MIASEAIRELVLLRYKSKKTTKDQRKKKVKRFVVVVASLQLL
jgi:hypothetical protein